MQIALLAYDAMPEQVRRDLSRLLRQHPRFSEDFLARLPPALASDAERERWLFAHAATWPDLARGQPAYEHGPWHYVNLPLLLKNGKLVSCAEARAAFPASARQVAEHHAAARGARPAIVEDSIREALPQALGVLGDIKAKPADRALALSWVLHLVGDAHQPLHGVALFTARRFVTGDRGGNDIAITDRGSLHRVWDGLLGEDTSPAVIERAVARLRAEPDGAAAAARAAGDLDVDRWIDEGCELARTLAYVPAVLRAVQEVEDGASAGKPEAALCPTELHAARLAARRRAVQAGARLARWLEKTSAQFNIERGLRPRP